MKTGLFNWRRVLLAGQTLCLVAVAAIFLVSPLAVLAGCGGGGGGGGEQVEIDQSIKIVGSILQVDKALPTGVKPLNAALTVPGSEAAGAITVNKKFTVKELANGGLWITGIRNGVMFQGTVFNVRKVNGGKSVAEVWIAEVAPNTKKVKPGQVIKNVSLAGIPAK